MSQVLNVGVVHGYHWPFPVNTARYNHLVCESVAGYKADIDKFCFVHGFGSDGSNVADIQAQTCLQLGVPAGKIVTGNMFGLWTLPVDTWEEVDYLSLMLYWLRAEKVKLHVFVMDWHAKRTAIIYDINGFKNVEIVAVPGPFEPLRLLYESLAFTLVESDPLGESWIVKKERERRKAIIHKVMVTRAMKASIYE